MAEIAPLRDAIEQALRDAAKTGVSRQEAHTAWAMALTEVDADGVWWEKANG